jgi:cell division protein FtsN
LDMKTFRGVGLGALVLALLIILLLALYHFVGIRTAPAPTAKSAEKPQTLPGVSQAPGTPPPLAAPMAPSPQQPPGQPGKEVGTPETIPPKTAIVPPAAKEQPLPPLEEERKYGLSVGHFPNFRSAEKMLEKLRKQGEEGFVRRTPGKKKGYQVIAGPFSSKAEAEAAAKSLRTKLHVAPKLETIIIPVSK